MKRLIAALCLFLSVFVGIYATSASRDEYWKAPCGAISGESCLAQKMWGPSHYQRWGKINFELSLLRNDHRAKKTFETYKNYRLAQNVIGSGVMGDAKAGGAPAAYTGPGDIITYTAYYGLRAYSSATRGNKLVNVCNSTGGVDVGCADLSSDPTTGQLVPATVAGITCPGANCTIKTFYDLTAGNACSAATCDVTQATVASRMTLGTSCAPATVSTCATAPGIYANFVNTINLTAAPLFMSATALVTNTGNEQAPIGDFSANHQIYYWFHGGVPTAGVTADQSATIVWQPYTSGSYQAISGLSNGASSFLSVASAVATGTLTFNSTTGSVITLGGDSFGNNLAAGEIFLEAGLSLSAPSSGTATTLNANSKTFWGF